MRKIAVVGSGSWGIALSNHLAECGNKVSIWSFTEEEKNAINNEHRCIFIPGSKINENVVCSNDMEEVIKDSEFILHVTPSKFTRNTFNQYKKYVGNKPVVICSKGLEDSTLLTLDDVIKQELKGVRIAAISGPSYATEVLNHVPTAVILASEDEEILNTLPEIFSNENMRIYKSKDVKGVEIGGALKNIIAFGAGICTELGYGMNAQAALITRGLAEISRLGVKMGAKKETFYGLSGLGDLILTCSSDESRNKRAGRLIGQGKTIEETKKEIGMTIESFDNIEVAKKLSEKFDVEMPVVDAAYEIINNKISPKEVVVKLMKRNLKFE